MLVFELNLCCLHMEKSRGRDFGPKREFFPPWEVLFALNMLDVYNLKISCWP